MLEAVRLVPGVWPLLRELRRTLVGCESVLDVGCGNLSPLRTLGVERLVGLEGFEPALKEAERNRTHDEVVLGDVREVGAVFGGRRFDACVALDLIEHLPKESGWKLLDDLEGLARKRVVIFTPNGFLPQRGQGDLQEHLSGWTAEEMRGRGYRVIGFYGHKALRGEYHRLKGRPKVFWAVVSTLSQVLVARRRPEKAAAIYCVKDVGSSV
jgi:SAM-dependent methyltransferase